MAQHFVETVEGIVGARWVRRSSAELDTYASDGLPTRFSRPRAVVLPGTREEVIRVVTALARAGVPFVARGAGTGLSGGAVADGDAIVIALTRLNRILSVDSRNRRAMVEPGVVHVRPSEAELR